MRRRIVIGITGASGVIFGIRLLEILNSLKFTEKLELHLILSKFAIYNIKLETEFSTEYVRSLVDIHHQNNNLAAPISSGSFLFEAMIIVPCSMKTLATISHGLEDNLITRSAHVALKEKRRVILAIRESPLNSIHIENMLKLSNLGVSICPLTPSFYNKPENIEDLINYTVYRLLDLIDIRAQNILRWDKSLI